MTIWIKGCESKLVSANPKPLAGYSGGIRIDEYFVIVGFLRARGDRVADRRRRARMARQNEAVRHAGRRDHGLGGAKNLVERTVDRLRRNVHAHDPSIQPFVDSLPKGKDAARQTNEDEDGAHKEPDVFVNRQPKFPADDEPGRWTRGHARRAHAPLVFSPHIGFERVPGHGSEFRAERNEEGSRRAWVDAETVKGIRVINRVE